MFEKRVIIGKKYCVTAPSACLITANINGVVVTLVDESTAGQYYFYAPTSSINSSVDPSYILEVAKSGGASTTIRSGSSCNCAPYELTAEAIQQVVPMAWSEYTVAPTITGKNNIVFGNNSTVGEYGVLLAVDGYCAARSSALGYYTRAEGMYSACFGFGARTGLNNSVAIGAHAKTIRDTSICIGSQFSDTAGSYTCTTEGTGSITIGAGANTLNNGDTESSNSVTIGCKAENKGADSVVIGAQAKGQNKGSVAIGAASISQINGVGIGIYAKAQGTRNIAIGESATTETNNNIALGARSKSAGNNNIAIGYYAASSGTNTISIGVNAKVSDLGATVIRSTAEDGTYTQLYFSGANTPLANTYENGEAMMGYVVRDSAGNVMTDAEGNAMVGTQKLSVLFPNNRGENAFAPTTLGLDDEWTPKPMFHPSDLDLPIEEPDEEPYTPLPVYPIVEPEIPLEP